MTTRATFSEDLLPIADQLSKIFPKLEAHPDWYGSIFFERTRTRSYQVDLKKSEISDSIQSGVVLRIYDGYTLFEEATDDLTHPGLQKAVDQILSRAQRGEKDRDASSLQKRVYKPESWKDRLAQNLDPEITGQISGTPKKETWVHFGIRVQENPKTLSDSAWLDRSKQRLEDVKRDMVSTGLLSGDLTYARVVHRFGVEESIFIDRETRMTQSIYRMLLSVVLMSGAERAYFRDGGLGGLEAIAFSQKEIIENLKDLAALKTAEKLTPGKYKILMAPPLTGVLAHEAFGHSQEADTCARGRSKAWDLSHTEEHVGNEHATILNNPAVYENDGHLFAAWGSYFFDEEGWLAKEQVILDKGRLSNPMTNLTSALRLGIPRTANGKRENWAHGVYSRQTNTYFSAGHHTFEELLGMIDDGFYASHAAGGMEDPKGMGIQVGISFLHEVKKGKLTGRVFRGPAGGDIQMTGYTPDVLNSIIGKSKSQGKHPRIDVGGCGKYHKEIVQAGCGGPHLLLDGVTLG